MSRLLLFTSFVFEPKFSVDGGRDVSLLSADQALIVSGRDHSFPSAPGPHTWPHGHGPENHPGSPSEVNSDASQPEVSGGQWSSGESGHHRAMSVGGVTRSRARCQHRWSRDVS